MWKIFLVLLLLTGLSSCDSKINSGSSRSGTLPELKEDKNSPQWLLTNNDNAQQTSGITFLGLDSTGGKNFLIADDIGKIHRMVISNDIVSRIAPVYLSQQVKDYFSPFPKWDFEEISYDKYTGNVYLSIEGNGKSFKDFTGIFNLIFAGGNIYSDTVISVEKLEITPESLFKKYIADNMGYEGLASDKNYIYLGLEGFAEDDVFSDHTIIFVVDKTTLKIIKEISTEGMGIQSISGLYSDQDNSIFGIDRNNKKLFHIVFDKSLDISDCKITSVKTYIPAYHPLTYVAALESITMDDEKNIYFIDDPWKKYFIPSEQILKKLDSVTVRNFENFVPVIFKFNHIN